LEACQCSQALQSQLEKVSGFDARERIGHTKISMLKLSWNEIPYGIRELKRDAALRYSAKAPYSLLNGEFLQCCINDCEELIARRHRNQKPSFCSKHGISMSSKPTYIYQDPERNFIIGRDVLQRISKVERWRLGFETSEDAVSWNVFVGLYALGALPETFEALTGMAPIGAPELYLWGNRIDISCRKWANLLDVRAKLENHISIPTEPDIILRVPEQAVVLIEAKFGSPNSRLAGKKKRFGSVWEFLGRYRCRQGAADPLNRKWISEQKDEQILEQLCRNAIFAHWLASENETAILINLVRRASRNDEQVFREHLSKRAVVFHVRVWEDLFGLPAIQREEASVLRDYLKNKTLNLARAFDLDVMSPLRPPIS
jgi:hypothetical protein